MIAWMTYAALIGLRIGAGAFAIERLVVSGGKPRRFVWLAALGLAVVIPVAGGLRQPSASAVLEPTPAEPPPGPGTRPRPSPGQLATSRHRSTGS